MQATTKGIRSSRTKSNPPNACSRHSQLVLILRPSLIEILTLQKTRSWKLLPYEKTGFGARHLSFSRTSRPQRSLSKRNRGLPFLERISSWPTPEKSPTESPNAMEPMCLAPRGENGRMLLRPPMGMKRPVTLVRRWLRRWPLRPAHPSNSQRTFFLPKVYHRSVMK